MSRNTTIVEGKEFKSFREACCYYKIDYGTGKSRISNGWSVEEALGIVPRKTQERAPKVGKKVLVGGKEFNSVSDVCRHYGVSYNAARYRVYRTGCSIEEAIFSLIEKGESSKIVVGGIGFKNKIEACKYYGIERYVVDSRLKSGMSLEEAILTEKRFSRKKFKIDGKEFNSLAEACRYYNVSYVAAKHRCRKGYSVEGVILDLIKKREDRKVIIEGKKYNSVADASEVYGVKPNTVIKRLNSGWSVEEALELVPKCIDGIICSYAWGKNNVKDVKIEDYLGNDIYKCIEEGNIRYYSKDELFEKFKESRNNKD